VGKVGTRTRSTEAVLSRVFGFVDEFLSASRSSPNVRRDRGRAMPTAMTDERWPASSEAAGRTRVFLFAVIGGRKSKAFSSSHRAAQLGDS